MDFDLGQVRAFVTAAEELHFGRAAERLFLTPQALSKRIRRLELLLTLPLFTRNTRTVELTTAGADFLPHARMLITVADEAAAAARSQLRPLNIDGWSYEQFPWQVTERIAARMPELQISLSTRRSLPRAVAALQRGEVDAAFGRAHDLGHPWPAGITTRPIRLEAYGAVLSDDHPLAGATVLRPEQIRPYGLWFGAGPPEAAGFTRRYGQHFRIPVEYGGTAAGLDSFVSKFRSVPGRISLAADSLRLPSGLGLRMVPIEPTPLCPWSLAWRTGDRHPSLHRFLRALADLARAENWLAHDPHRHWLSAADAADLAG